MSQVQYLTNILNHETGVLVLIKLHGSLDGLFHVCPSYMMRICTFFEGNKCICFSQSNSRTLMTSCQNENNYGNEFSFLPAAKPRRSMDDILVVGGGGGVEVVFFLLGKFCENNCRLRQLMLELCKMDQFNEHLRSRARSRSLS